MQWPPRERAERWERGCKVHVTSLFLKSNRHHPATILSYLRETKTSRADILTRRVLCESQKEIVQH